MTKSIGLSILCLGLLIAAPRNVSAQAAGTAAVHPRLAPVAAPSAPQQAAAPQKQSWSGMGEYKAFMAFANETDPAKQVSLIADFLAKYPKSDFKDRAYVAEMQAYARLNNSAKAIGAAEEAIKADPDNIDVGYDLEGLGYLSFTFPYTYNATAADAQDQLSQALANGQKGLELLQKFQKPANATEEQFEATVKPMRANFNTVVGFVDLQKKDYTDAITSLKAAVKDDPSSSLVFSLMGQSYYYSTPPDFNNAIWYLARSVALARAAKSANADALQKFYDQAYVSRHCSNAGENDIITQAATSVDPPQGFAVTRPQPHSPTGDKNVDAFYKNIEDPLTVNCANAQQIFNQLKGQQLSLVGTVVGVAPGPDATTTVVNVAITPDSKSKPGAFDVQMQDATQADAKLLRPGDPAPFTGTIAAYAASPNFYVTLSNATITDDRVLKMAAERQKAEEQGKKRPVRRPIRRRPAGRRGR